MFCALIMRDVAILRGIHVLRFDYAGCGDSAGSWENSSVNDWINDIELAAEELQALSMVDNLTFLGVRLGASLLTYANLKRVPAKKFVLWDPILVGAQYLESLTHLQVKLVDDRSRFELSRVSYLDEHEMELLGYPVSAETMSQLNNLNMLNNEWNSGETILLYSHNKSAYSSFSKSNQSMELRALSLPCNWETLDHFESQVLVPEMTSIVNDFIN
jgi:pimeloyl-ACP methyl ester carboxylesterase